MKVAPRTGRRPTGQVGHLFQPQLSIITLALLTLGIGLVQSAVDSPQPPQLHALKLNQPNSANVKIDGLLSEDVWQDAEAATNFRQREPLDGAPATERTEVRVIFDSQALYIGILAHDRMPEKIISRILQRDSIMQPGFSGRPAFVGDDAVAILLDPFHDHRSALIFATNPNGAQFDATLTDEGQEFNIDWRGVWQVAAKRTPEGWSSEFAIPFRTLRYPAATNQTWGFNVYRVIRHKNEEVLWSSWSRENEGFARVSRAGHLHGMSELPRPSLNLEIKPFGLSRVSHALNELSATDMTGRVKGGLDAKWEIRPGLLLDATLNTDFAQVEVDDEQVNLTRFDLFFPEKRDFFVENAGIFSFGDRGMHEAPPFLLFFSRRIGLSENGEIPVLGGARLTGRAGDQTIGALNVVTEAQLREPRTNFAVARAKRDVGNGGYLGLMVTDRRSKSSWNTGTGFDWSLWPSKTVNVLGFFAQTLTSGSGGDDHAYRVAVDITKDRFGFFGQHLMVGKETNAEMGFITRTNIRRSNAFMRLTARPKKWGLRALNLNWVGAYVTKTNFEVQDWETGLALNPQLESGESLNLFYLASFTRVDETFGLTDEVTIAAGDYPQWQVGLYFNTSSNRALVFNSQNTRQRFFHGVLTSIHNDCNLALSSNLSLSLGYTHNHVALPSGSFDADLASVRISYAFSTRLVVKMLLQYNRLDNRLSTNFRLNFVHRPGSDLYFVYNEQYGSDLSLWAMESRTAVLKLTYLQRL